MRRADTDRLRAALLTLTVVAACAHGQQAVVRSYDAPDLEVGQAWLVRSGERCLGVLPHHVSLETSVPSLLREGSAALRGEALEVIDLGDDAAVAVMSGGITRDCGTSLGSISRGVERHLQGGGIGALRYVNGDGTIGRLAVTVVDDDGATLLRVQPTTAEQTIRKGLSGSLLVVNDQSVGMLLSVSARSGIGTVMRSDALLGKVESWLRGDRERVVAASAPSTESPVDAPAATPASEGSWSVIAWNADPVGSAHTAARLTAPGTDGHWAARVERWPAAIELGGPGPVVIVAGVLLLAGEEVDAQSLPSRVQVLTSVAADRPAWRVAASAALHFHQGAAEVSFPPTRARFLRLEFFETTGGSPRIVLSRVRVLPP